MTNAMDPAGFHPARVRFNRQDAVIPPPVRPVLHIDFWRALCGGVPDAR